MTIRLIVKGDFPDAAQIARMRGIHLEPASVSADGITMLRCSSDQIDRVVAWYCEGPIDPPHPIGTLLEYSK